MKTGDDLSTCPSCGATLTWDWDNNTWIHRDTGQEECENWSDEQEQLLQEHYALDDGEQVTWQYG